MRRTRLGSGPRGRTDDALGDGLAVWDETRAAPIADAIDRLTDAALAAWPPPRTTNDDAFQAAWLRSLADARGRGWAARTLFDRLPGRDRRARGDALHQRLRALIDRDPDPRVGHALARALGRGEPLLGYYDVAQACETLLWGALDARTRALLEPICKSDDEDRAIMVRRVCTRRLDTRAVTRRELDRFTIAVPPRRQRASRPVAALHAQVRASPAADPARSVLADALQADGDPRGELIALQLVSGVDPARHRRIDQLIRACGADWMGSLAEVTLRAQFERGFVTRLELGPSWSARRASWTDHAMNPVLATVETLVPGRSTGAAYAVFLRSSAMPALRRVEVFDRDSAEALTLCPAPLVHVACATWTRGSYARGLDLVLPACERIPTVVSLAVAAAGYPRLAAHKPLLGRLTSLVVGGDTRAGLAVWPQLPRATELVIARSARLDPCSARRGPQSGELRLARDGKAVIARASGVMIDELVTHAGAVPDLRVLVVEAEREADHRALRRVAAARRLALEWVDVPRRSGYVTALRK